MPTRIDLRLIGNVINASSLSNSMSTCWLDLELVPGQLMHTQPRLNADGMALMQQKVVAGNLVAPQLCVHEAWAVEQSLSQYYDQILILPAPEIRV